MRISTKDIQVGDLIRLADGTRGEVLSINRRGSLFRWTMYLKDDIGRVGIHWLNDAGSVEKIDSLAIYNPYGPKED